jgi:hypothetical protein
MRLWYPTYCTLKGVLEAKHIKPHFICDPLRGRIYFIQSTRGGRRCAPRPRAKIFDPDGIMITQTILASRRRFYQNRPTVIYLFAL